MTAIHILKKINEFPWKKHRERIQSIIQKRPLLLGIGAIAVLMLLNLADISHKEDRHIIERRVATDFQQGRILNDRESTFYYGKERQLSKKTQAMLDGQNKLEEKIAELEKKLQEVQSPPVTTGTPVIQEGSRSTSLTGEQSHLQLYETPEGIEPSTVTPLKKSTTGARTYLKKGSDLISFPVKPSTSKSEDMVLPAGSYVKAKILTGVDVPVGKTYPVLMVLDFSYIAPNDHRIDLSGCFMIAKAEGDLSTERVQMQATKMSCVSKKGKMFERAVNGFVADNNDGSFAMKGKVNSKQGRVAATAFLAGVVEGVGKAVQAAQTTQSTNAFGGSTSVLTGDTATNAMAGGASNAAGMVAQWYLQQAQNLAPTVEVGSGRDVWIVMNDKVKLPEEFFKKERSAGSESIYSYFTRVLE